MRHFKSDFLIIQTQKTIVMLEHSKKIHWLRGMNSEI